jgi:hypothetical protein
VPLSDVPLLLRELVTAPLIAPVRKLTIDADTTDDD